ncbi:MAG: hypothetical protein GY768_25985 [Planctomycetaceae bacterium]|nr:hypothetical protein [Planctomycetaceae bacterium]
MSQIKIPLSSARDASARSNTYRLLARLWQRELDAKLLEVLQDPSLSESFLAAGGVLPTNDADTVEQLAIDFCQLFVGPKNHLPPYQSVWESGQLDGEATVSMRQFCEVVHFEPADPASGMLLDHLGVQLDVMAHILQLVAESEGESLEHLLDIGRCYAVRHLLWPGELLTASASRATTDFYRCLPTLTRQFLELETVGLSEFSPPE